MSASMADRPLTRQALIDGGWQCSETGWWRHPDVQGWMVSAHGTPVLFVNDATTAAAIAALTSAPTPEPDDLGWSERQWTRAEPDAGWLCSHPAHSAYHPAAVWKLYTGLEWEGAAACAEHLPAGLTPDGAA